MSIKKGEKKNGEIVAYSYNRILLSNKTKQTIDVHNYIDKAHTDERKPFIKRLHTV